MRWGASAGECGNQLLPYETSLTDTRNDDAPVTLRRQLSSLNCFGAQKGRGRQYRMSLRADVLSQ